jgi:ectoine hydroxylase-related dioxygenase (phytanoyl-CoA dioxygenase family)
MLPAAFQQAVAALEADGVCVWPARVPDVVVDWLCDELEPLWAEGSRRGGVRDLLARSAAVRELARSAPVREALGAVLGPGAFAVRGLLFDKTPSANWKVIWHQDLTLAVRERHLVQGFGPWSQKAGIPHVQAPVALLERMLAVRVHLDPCGPADGPLRVIPGSHRSGRLNAEAIGRVRERAPERLCGVDRGGLLLMRPLVLHASSAAGRPTRRRVVHLEMAAEPLPEPLRWRELPQTRPPAR